MGTITGLTLKGSRPAELLAYLSHAHGAPIEDCVAVIGISAESILIGAARIPGAACRAGTTVYMDLVTEILEKFASRDVTSLVVAAIGPDPMTEPPIPNDRIEMSLALAALSVAITADHTQGMSARTWTMGDGAAHRIVDQGDLDFEVTETVPLTDGTTQFEADLVHAGQPLARPHHGSIMLNAAQRIALQDLVDSSTATQNPLVATDTAWQILVTRDCLSEQLSDEAVLGAVAILTAAVSNVHGRDRLIDLVVGTDDELGSSIRTTLDDPEARPGPAVIPGGHVHHLISDVSGLLDESGIGHPAARAALHCLLATLGWWDCRFASTAEHVDAAKDADPSCSLADLLGLLLDSKREPAWASLRN